MIKRKNGFTLAEVLITLVIIGIVAVLTIPNIIQKYKKIEVETKLKRFYVMANQAILLSEIENGPKQFWEFETPACASDAYSEACLRGFWEKYLEKYFKYTRVEYAPYYGKMDTVNYLYVYLLDGSKVGIGYRGNDYLYFVRDTDTADTLGKDTFFFAFYPQNCSSNAQRNKFFCNQGIVPYLDFKYDGTLEYLYSQPNNYTKLIELNGWKIPDDYPIKF